MNNNFVDFDASSSEYLGRATEDALAIHNDLTLGCWVYFDAESTGSFTGIISKWYETGDERSYALYKNANNDFCFSVSNLGNDIVTVNDNGANYAVSNWFYIVGRFTAGIEMAIFVNGIWYKSKASVPATIFHSSEAFEIGRFNRSNYLDGRVCHAFISAYSIPDRFICAMYAHSRAMFISRPNYNRPCSDATVSTSSSTTSTSSSTSSSTTSSSSSSVAP